MRAGFAGFFRRGVFKHVAEEFGVHPGDGQLIDLFKVFDVAHFKIVERETIETVAFRVDVHWAVVGATEIKILIPILHRRNRLTAMIKKPLDQGRFLFLDLI